MFHRYKLFAIFLVGWLVLWPMMNSRAENQTPSTVLAPVWNQAVSRWDTIVANAANQYGLDPDLIAAIIFAESSGYADQVSYAGAVGLMGIMPNAKDFPNRPKKADLFDPVTNINWGCAILADILRQSGGDLSASLAAYNGGWEQIDHHEPRGYAENVLNLYGQAIVARNGVDPAIAHSWKIGIVPTKGEISVNFFETIVDRDLPIIGEHPIYRGQDIRGNTYDVRGYAIPVNLVPGWKSKFPHLDKLRLGLPEILLYSQ